MPVFVHAGVRQGVPLEHQKDDDLLWIRKPFLNRPHGLLYSVVHRHTIRLPHRIGIDTGAFKSGRLTALPLEPYTNHDNRQVELDQCMPAALDPPLYRLEYSNLLTAVIEMTCQMLVLPNARTSFARLQIHTSSTSDHVHNLSRLLYTI